MLKKKRGSILFQHEPQENFDSDNSDKIDIVIYFKRVILK